MFCFIYDAAADGCALSATAVIDRIKTSKSYGPDGIHTNLLKETKKKKKK